MGAVRFYEYKYPLNSSQRGNSLPSSSLHLLIHSYIYIYIYRLISLGHTLPQNCHCCASRGLRSHNSLPPPPSDCLPSLCSSSRGFILPASAWGLSHAPVFPSLGVGRGDQEPILGRCTSAVTSHVADVPGKSLTLHILPPLHVNKFADVAEFVAEVVALVRSLLVGG